MPLPAGINIDMVLSSVLGDVMAALQGWRQGIPRDETAFMNWLSGQLLRRRKGCDVGCQLPMTMTTQMSLLHRRGLHNTDQYGSDLAITIGIHNCSYLKTCIVQLKKSRDYRAKVMLQQLMKTTASAVVAERSFVAAFDEVRPCGVRLMSAQELADEFNSHQTSKQFHTEKWLSLSEWLLGWLSCSIGPMSERNDPLSVERLLERYRVPERKDDEWTSPWQEERQAWTQPPHDEPGPADAWMALFFDKP